MPSLANCRLNSALINLIRCQTRVDGFCDSRIRKRTVFCPPSPAHLALCHARNLRKSGRQQRRASLLQRRQDNLEFQRIKSGRAIMSRFLIATFVGATIVAAVSTSASAYHCLARAPNGRRRRPWPIAIGIYCHALDGATLNHWVTSCSLKSSLDAN